VPFPFEYIGSQEIHSFERSDIPGIIEHELKKRKIKFKSNDSELRFDLFSTFFRLRFKSIIRIDPQNDETEIHYAVNLSGLVRLIIYVIIICIVLSVKSIELFLITSIVFSVLFYFINFAEIIFKLNRILSPVLRSGKKDPITEVQISKLQEDWMKDNNRCPACGCDISVFDTQCPICGIKVRESIDTPVNHTKGKGIRIHYHFKTD
jgi:hypothetical protein